MALSLIPDCQYYSCASYFLLLPGLLAQFLQLNKVRSWDTALGTEKTNDSATFLVVISAKQAEPWIMTGAQSRTVTKELAI